MLRLYSPVQMWLVMHVEKDIADKLPDNVETIESCTNVAGDACRERHC